MRRPLLCGCICLFFVIALWTQITNPPPWNGDNTGWEGEFVSLMGQVYQKEYRISYGEEKLVLYLDSIFYSEETEVSFSKTYSEKLSKINPLGKIICEINISDLPKDAFIPLLGNTVIIEGIWEGFSHATNPGEFDSANYYAIEGICARVQEADLIGVGKRCWPIREGLYRVRQHLLKNLYETFEEREASILAKMLLGDGSGLDKEIRELYQSNGIVHILSISGLHITMLGMGVYIFMRRLTLPTIQSAILGGVFILLYGIMTGFGISSCRAIGMYLIHMLGEIIGKTYDMLTAMGVLALTMLLNNPLLAYHSGFLLSFTSVCGVGLLAPFLQFPQEWFRKKPGDNTVLSVCKSIMEKSFAGFSVSLSVTLFTLPIQLFFFYKIPVYSVVINLFVIPFMSVVMIVGLLVMVLPALSFLCPIEVGVFNWFEWLCLCFEKLPGHTLLVGRPAMSKVLLYYVVLLMILLLGKRLKKCVSIMGIAVLVSVMIVHLSKGTEIYLLDVGQGDCICVRTADNHCFLFDGGSSSKQNIGEKVIIPFLEYHGIGRIDGVFVSHADMDHYSGILQILEEELMPVDRIYLPDVGTQSKREFEKLLDAVEEQKVQYVQRGDSWRTEDFSLLCMHPYKGYEAESNAYSTCFLLEKEEFTMLLTGDVEGEGERLLLQELKNRMVGQVDVLKVAHHGSRYSTTEDFLGQIEPRVALISCGRNNVYGHPHGETMERLEAVGSMIWTTPESGSITIAIEDEIEIRSWRKLTKK